jgi:hypothetical protein
MIRLLVILSVTGLLLCVVCISSALALGGREIATKGWSWNWSDWAIRIDEDNDDFSITPAENGKGGVWVNGERVDENDDYVSWANGPTETRDFPWTGSGEIDIGLPADIVYTQGPAPKVTVTGPVPALERFHVDGGRFRLRGWSASNTFNGIPGPGDISSNRPPRLKIEVVAPGVTRFDLSGTETIDIKNYNQDSLTLELSGASKATVQGGARLAVLDLDGAARADLAKLNLEQASADMSDASFLIMAPRASANIEADDAAHVTLNSRPQQLTQDLEGAAVVDGPGVSMPAPATTAAKSK